MSNNSNFNYLQTIPNEPSPTPSYQPAQQYPQQQFNIQQSQVMGPNGKMINRPELDKSIMRFEKVNPIYDFDIIRAFLPKTLDDYYKKYFNYLDTIKQRRGMEEYLSDLRKILNKMNEYVSKTEQSIIKLKKTLDYTESTIPIQSQFQPINGKPQTPNIFTIPELQNVVEKDNNIDFVDIFGLKGKNVSYIPPENRNLIVIIVQSLMGFNPQISPDPRVNAKLNNCLNKLKYQIIDYSINSVANTDKLEIDDKNPEFKPLVKIDIYSKLFDIFNKGSINIKDIKTDKISERIETTPEKSASPSYSSFPSYSYGGSPDYSSFGGPKKNNQQKNRLRSQPGNSKQNISTKIKIVLKYEIGTTNSGNTQIEIERAVRKKGQEMTEYLFNNKDIEEHLKNIKLYKNNINNQQNQLGGIDPVPGKGTGTGKGPVKGPVKGTGKGTGKGNKNKNQEIKELNGNTIIKYLKNSDSKYNELRKLLKDSNMNDFLKRLKDAYADKKKGNLTQVQKDNLRSEISTCDTKITSLKRELEQSGLIVENIKDIETQLEEQRKIRDSKYLKLNPSSKYSEADIENIVINLNEYLKGLIEQYKTRILYRAEESFGNEKCSVIDFFTGIQDMAKIQGSYKRNKKNDEKKSITYIQIYMMMYEAYKEYYKTYSIETIIKSFTKDTIKTDYDLKMRILNGLGLYSVIIYKKLKIVKEMIKTILQQSNPDFEKAKTMLTKVQTLINSTADEAKKEKLLKMKKNIENEIEKLTDNKKNNRGQNRKNTYGNTKPWEKDKSENKKPWEKDKFGEKKPWEKDKDKFGEKKYKKSYNNNNVSL